jgi:hypothetical protein
LDNPTTPATPASGAHGSNSSTNRLFAGLEEELPAAFGGHAVFLPVNSSLSGGDAAAAYPFSSPADQAQATAAPGNCLVLPYGKQTADGAAAGADLADGGVAGVALYGSSVATDALDVEVSLSLQILAEGGQLDAATAAALGVLTDLEDMPCGPEADAAAPVFAQLAARAEAGQGAGVFPWQAATVMAVAACEIARRQVTRSATEADPAERLAQRAIGPRRGEVS